MSVPVLPPMRVPWAWSGERRSLELGRGWLERGAFGAAAECFERLLGRAPTAVGRRAEAARLAAEARVGLGLAHFHAGRDAEARGEIERALAWNPEARLRYFRARVLFRAGRAREAVAELERAIQDGFVDPDAWMLLAVCRRDAGGAGATGPLLDRALALALHDLARIGRGAARGGATAARGSDRERPPTSPRSRAIAGELEAATRAVAARPSYPDLRLRLAAAWLAAGDLRSAERELERALEIHPGYLEARALRTRVRLWRGDAAAAACGLESLIETRPEYPDLLFWLAVARLQASEADRAVAPLERAVAINRHFARAHRLVGLVHHGFGRPAESLAALRRGFQRDRDLATSTLDVGRAETTGAERAVALRPRYPDLHLALARGRRARGDLERARESCAQALLLHPGFDAAALELARLDLDLGRPAAAERALEALTRRHSGWADAHALLGRARKMRANPCGAAEALRHALRLNPVYSEAREDLAWALQSGVGSTAEDDGEAAAVLADQAASAEPANAVVVAEEEALV